ncbi:acyl-CoA dehydrogenase [Streptomyces alkaliphilus]|uniref:Acyl-CoA dehydrogenase n=1 Tax=Streptomyces alkaliphilus TaxID=1472722 RepID=A0A7W3XZU5_9ACTN|nr:acyl-CoA dehydrogenase [Streptomyces alkaliphilus]MBB0242713.1 acyl-CoA dehydrogenase [Streptomyces alkaliphilus]
MSDTIAACEAAAHTQGLAAGLALALREAGPVDPPGGIAALPADAVPGGAAVLPHRLAERERVRFVRLPLPAPGADAPTTRPPTGDRADPDTGDAPAPLSFDALLGAVRAGLTRRLLDDAVTHLSGRTSGGEPLSRKQLVLGTVADVRTGLAAAVRLLRVAGGSPVAVTDAHDRLTALDWEAAKLLGASGFLADGSARAGYVGWLVASVWLADPSGATPAGPTAPPVGGRPLPEEDRS